MKPEEQKALLKKCRHKAEIPITIASVVITVLFVIFVIFLIHSLNSNQWAEDFLINRLEFEENEIHFALRCGKFLAIVIFAFLILKLIWELFRNAGIAIAEDVPIEESDSPEIFREYRVCCEKLGIQKIPRLFLAADRENLEATGVKIKSGRYLRVDMSALDTVDATEDDNVIRFEILHELAHMAYRHYSYPILIATVAARWLPFIKNIYSRVMCYSADRLTAELLGREECLTVLLENYMSLAYEADQRDEYLKRLDRKFSSTEKLSAVLNNLTTPTPSYLYRLKAIRDNTNGKII